VVWRSWPHTQVYWVSTTQKRCYHGTILTEVSSPNLHGRLNVQPMALERAQPSQHTMCRAVNERARLLLQFDGPLGLPKWPFRRAMSTPSHHLNRPHHRRVLVWSMVPQSGSEPAASLGWVNRDVRPLAAPLRPSPASQQRRRASMERSISAKRYDPLMLLNWYLPSVAWHQFRRAKLVPSRLEMPAEGQRCPSAGTCVPGTSRWARPTVQA